MLDKLTYISGSGKKIEFGRGNILINTNDARDYSWTHNKKFTRIASFNREIKTIELPLLIYGQNEKEIANEIFTIIEEDVLTHTYGKLYTDTGYYIRGYFIESKKTQYTANGFLNMTLTFISDKPYWTKEYLYEHRATHHGDIEEGSDLDYPHDFTHDYFYGKTLDFIENVSFIDQNMRLVIHGRCVNPRVVIGDNIYSLNISLESGEVAIIDTAEYLIQKIDANGVVTNIFSARDPNWYIFSKIKKGVNLFNVSPEANVDVVVYDERSEPEW